VSGLLACMLWD